MNQLEYALFRLEEMGLPCRVAITLIVIATVLMIMGLLRLELILFSCGLMIAIMLVTAIIMSGPGGPQHPVHA